MAEMKLENVHNTIVGSTVTTEGGDVIVNGQKVTNVFYSAQYQDLQKQYDAFQERFAKTQQKIKKYADDEDFKIELLRIDTERRKVQTKLDDLKSEVIRLAETFTRIPINTERLRLARQHFETGNYGAARAILDAEQMSSELDALLRVKEQLHQRQAENETCLIDKANEFLILARLTAVDFALASRFEKTVEYFEQSLKAAHTLENTFAYAYFLQQHNQFNAALPWYEAALSICRTLAEANPQTYLPYVATTLNNLASLRRAKNQFLEAEAAYEEALGMYRTLAESNPQTYLPDVAMTLNNLAILRAAKNQFPEAEAAYEETLGMYRTVAESNPQTYLPDVAMTLNNLANLRAAKNQFPEAEAAYEEALGMYRTLAESNPQTYLPDVAMTLNNLANLRAVKNQFPEAEAAYEETLGMYRTVAESNPQTYLPYVATTLNNLAILRKAKSQFPEAEAAYQEALGIRRTLAESNPQTYLPDVAMTLNNLANLRTDKNQFPEAEASYQEALGIYRALAQSNPQTYLPHVATTTVNMSMFYLESVPDQEKSLSYAREALLAALPFVESVPSVQNDARKGLLVAEAWGLNAEAFCEETIRAAEGADEG